MSLTERARLQGTHLRPAYRWFREGIPAVRVNPRPVLAATDAVTAPARGGLDLHARVSAHDQRAGPDRQAGRLTGWAGQCGRAVVRAGAEAGLG